RLEAGHAGRTSDVSGELAKHFQGGRDQRRALVYLEQAAVRAYDRHTYADVAAFVTPALALLAQAPSTPERARDELRLRRLHAAVLSQTSGYAAGALLENLTRMHGLCAELDVLDVRCDVLGSLCLLYANRGQLVEAGRIARELSEVAERLDPSALLQS